MKAATTNRTGVRDGKILRAVKAAYLSQVENEFFNVDAFKRANPSNAASLKTLVRLNLVAVRFENSASRYSLTPKGRSLLTIVLVGGVYDVLHLGHVAALEEAKTLGDLLVVIVAADSTVEKLKGRRPVFSENARCRLIRALKPVDCAVIGHENIDTGYERTLVEFSPNIVALGYDQDDQAKMVRAISERRGLHAKIARLSKFEQESHTSSTAVKEAIKSETSSSKN